MSKLVIVESPAKAKTIQNFLGGGYTVEASFGHVRDLPERAEDIPEEFKKEKWAKLGVNVEDGYSPLYIVPSDKKRHVSNLQSAARGATELLLATDEDREGESISWHILQLLKLKKGVKVQRIVFHELTPGAIKAAVANPRQVDEHLVRAQETRRILDRLYGYTLSPLLWKKVAPRLSAGRVQSVAVRLTVERERERMRFMAAEYWDIKASLETPERPLEVRLQRIGDNRVATGGSFDPESGQLKNAKEVLVSEARAKDLAERALAAKPWSVTDLVETPGTEKAPPPFMTSSLQQEAARKLRYTAKRTMQIAQQLYEGVDLGGERVGLITYMRTDSLSLASVAVDEAREVIRQLYGPEYLPAKPITYKTKSKSAQEAHEAIRPTSLARRPNEMKKYLSSEQFALYDLVWKRTIACQMKNADVMRSSLEVQVQAGADLLSFGASGKQILFPGFLRAYVEGSDDVDAELSDRETLLPIVKIGQELGAKSAAAEGHSTKPPARYTEASLVKKLETEGVGRPSTYASIISTIQDRGYVFKRGNELIPTFTAFAVTELLEKHFQDLVDTHFTARMEDELDQIADGKRDWVKHLHDFYRGKKQDGLESQVKGQEKNIPFPSLPIGVDPQTKEPITVRVGKFGPFLQREPGGAGNTANLPDNMAPAELTLEAALDLLSKKEHVPEALFVDPNSGRCVFHRSGRFGDYLELDQSVEEKEAGEKPRRITLPRDLKPHDLEETEVHLLLRFPYSLGKHPENGQDIQVLIGGYGAYVKCGEETRNIPDWRHAASLPVAEAVGLLSAPKGGRERTPLGEIKPIQAFGQLEGAQGEVRVLPGRFGPYVTDGKTNATIPRGTDPTKVTADMAMELLKAKAAAPKTAKRGWGRKKAATGKKK